MPVSFPELGSHLAQTCAGPLHSATVSVISSVPASCCFKTVLFPWCFPSPQTLHSFCLFFTGPLSPVGSDLMETPM